MTTATFDDLEHLGTGRMRSVYRLSLTDVIKVPLDVRGDLANEQEARRWERFGTTDTIQYAECAMFWFRGQWVLLMEYVEPVLDQWPDGLPDWTDFVDCCQVGYTLDGRLVAYDYADE